jgi:site-specific recombinase XerD
MEDGVDVYTVKRWMGHTSLATTSGYMHVTDTHMAKIRSPLDTIPSPGDL